MSIRLHTGLPGHGKTLMTLDMVNEWATREGREVYYSGIKDLKLSWQEIDPKDWKKCPPKSIVVIDEAQFTFGKVAKADDVPHIADLTVHRHGGIDIVLITQHPMLLDPFVRRLIDKHVHVVRRWGSQAATLHEWVGVGDGNNRFFVLLHSIAGWVEPIGYQFSSFVASALIRVPADEIMHLYIPDRIGQTRGVPWFHATLKRLRDMQGYEEAEIVAARASASIVGIIESEEGLVPDDVGIDDGEHRAPPTLSMEPGTFQQLQPGEKFTGFNPSRPNANMDAFMRFMLRAFCTGVGVSYSGVSGDWTQGTYSSLRISMLKDRDLWRVLQGWFIRNFRKPVHRDWLEASVLAGVLPFADYYTKPRKYWAVRFKPRGWSWIDPTKEVEAYRKAVRAGFMTVSDVISTTSEHADAEDVFNERRAELDMMAELDLVFDTDPAQTDVKGAVQTSEPPQETDVPVPGEDTEVEDQEDGSQTESGDVALTE